MPRRKSETDTPHRPRRKVAIPGWVNALLIVFGLLYVVLMLGGFWAMQM